MVFFTIMLLFTLFAKDLYYLTLPKVTTMTSIRKVFPYEMEGMDGSIITVERPGVAIPSNMAKGDSVYVLTETEQGAYVTKRKIQTGKSAGEWTEITEGLSGRTKVVMGSDRELKDGARVVIDEGNVGVSLYRMLGIRVVGVLDAQYYRNCIKIDIWLIILAAAFTLLLVSICKLYLKGRRRFLWSPVMILWCVLVCLCLRRLFMIPPEWVPEKLIDLNGWRENISRFWI